MSGNEPRTPGAALLVDIADNLVDLTMSRLGIPLEEAKAYSNAVAAYIADHWGGQLVYIPKDSAGKAMSRNAEIYSKFVGDNQAELAREYDLSVDRIYNIIAQERERRSVKQCGLPI